jgi:hypothetical protein
MGPAPRLPDGAYDCGNRKYGGGEVVLAPGVTGRRSKAPSFGANMMACEESFTGSDQLRESRRSYGSSRGKDQRLTQFGTRVGARSWTMRRQSLMEARG